MRKENHLISNALFIGFLLFAFANPGRLLAQSGTGEIPFNLHFLVDSTKQLEVGAIQADAYQRIFDRQQVELTNFGFDTSSYWFKVSAKSGFNHPAILEVAQTSLDTVAVYTFDGSAWQAQVLGHAFNPVDKPYSGVNFAFDVSETALNFPIYINVRTTGTVAVPIQLFTVNGYHAFKLKRTLFLGVFFGLMAVMAVYNLLLYTYLRDKAYLLYVGATIFGLATSLVLNGYGYLFAWPNNSVLDDHIYLTFAGISMVFSSRFAATFLNLKTFDPKMDRYLWAVAGASALMSVLSLFFDATQLLLYGRLIVLIAFPSYIFIGIRSYRRGYNTALYYVIAWLPYILGLILVLLRGAGLVPEMLITAYGVEIGGASEAVLLSLALAARIKGMRKEIAEKELEKEQFKTRLLSEQKVLLEQKVEERTKELEEANATKDKFFSIIAHDLRSPMIALQGVGQKLEYFIRKNKQEKLLEIGGKIDQSIDQLNHLLNNLLNWASSQRDAIPYHPERVSLKELVLENTNLYQALIEAKKLTVLTPETEGYVYADVNTLSTIVRNLLSNAIKFSNEGGSISMSWNKEDEELVFSIADNGVGMTAEQVANIFTEAGHSTTGAAGEKGFGLGLKLTKEFVLHNKGRITVESSKSSGTKFSVTLPHSKA
ncbi:sensor histidine kinase [Roseivirga pacifica]|uniref:sensor histidine kinase n=1 Tax=Roseivirga pacifica TaxID=1267423 RepID=UPI003BAF5F8A